MRSTDFCKSIKSFLNEGWLVYSKPPKIKPFKIDKKILTNRCIINGFDIVPDWHGFCSKTDSILKH